MSTPEETTQEQRSSIELALNSKRETQIKVKVYVNDTAEEIDAARERAEAVYQSLCDRLIR